MRRSRTSKIKAVIAAKCPRCRVGKMFVGNAYRFRKQRTNDVCPHCGFRFEIEPGYFYAAMYVSYAMAVMEVIAVAWLIYKITESESQWLYLGALLATILLFSPFNYRYSRLILLHYLTPKVKYNPKYEDLLAEENIDDS